MTVRILHYWSSFIDQELRCVCECAAYTAANDNYLSLIHIWLQKVCAIEQLLCLLCSKGPISYWNYITQQTLHIAD